MTVCTGPGKHCVHAWEATEGKNFLLLLMYTCGTNWNLSVASCRVRLSILFSFSILKVTTFVFWRERTFCRNSKTCCSFLLMVKKSLIFFKTERCFFDSLFCATKFHFSGMTHERDGYSLDSSFPCFLFKATSVTCAMSPSSHCPWNVTTYCKHPLQYIHIFFVVQSRNFQPSSKQTNKKSSPFLSSSMKRHALQCLTLFPLFVPQLHALIHEDAYFVLVSWFIVSLYVYTPSSSRLFLEYL